MELQQDQEQDQQEEEDWPNWHLPTHDLRLVSPAIDRNGDSYTVYRALHITHAMVPADEGEGDEGQKGREKAWTWFLVRCRNVMSISDAVSDRDLNVTDGAFYPSQAEAEAAGREHGETGAWPSHGRGRRL